MAELHRLQGPIAAQARIRKRYAELKQELAKLYPNDREAYAAGKTNFIRNALETM